MNDHDHITKLDLEIEKRFSFFSLHVFNTLTSCLAQCWLGCSANPVALLIFSSLLYDGQYVAPLLYQDCGTTDTDFCSSENWPT